MGWVFLLFFFFFLHTIVFEKVCYIKIREKYKIGVELLGVACLEIIRGDFQDAS